MDEEIIDALYRATRAGVDVDLLVRGICTLRPGVPGLSERSGCAPSSAASWSTPGCYGSATAAIEEFWIGSADLMHRNLDRRVEALVQVTDPTAQAELRRVFEASMNDTTAGFDLASDGSWHRRAAKGEVPLVDVQEVLLRRTLGRPE